MVLPTLQASAVAILALAGVSEAALPKRAVIVPSELPGAFEYYGCWTDVSGRTIGEATFSNNTGMTDEACINYCSSKGLQYAGTEYYQECYCGSVLATTAEKVDDSECSYPCTGNSSEACGGSSRLTMFYSPEPVGPQPNPGVDGWDYMGCYAEGTTGRTLTFGVGAIDGADMTVALCTAACKAAGYILAGVEYASQCYCGNTFSNGGAPATSGCNMICNGNSSEICGGADRLNVYNYLDGYSSTTGTATATPTGTMTSIVTSSAVATATALPSGWTYRGCWLDSVNGRIMPYQIDDSQTNSNELCVDACAKLGYTVAGTEYGVQCFCGNFTQRGAALVSDSQCSSTCPGNTAEK